MILALINNISAHKSKKEITNEKIIESWFSQEIDRFYFDYYINLKEWRQFDTDNDAHYFGIWVNLDTRQILSYIEGDIILTTCFNKECFKKELEEMSRFYGAPPPAVILLSENETVHLFDPRPEIS